jgi:hypothetical protein
MIKRIDIYNFSPSEQDSVTRLLRFLYAGSLFDKVKHTVWNYKFT